MEFALYPFLILCLGLALNIITDLIRPWPARSYQLCLFSVVGAFLFQLLALIQGPTNVWAPIDRVLQFDTLSQGFSTLALFLAFLALGISRESFQEEGERAAEYYGLLLTATLGAILVAHAEELLTFFLSFELLSIPLYVLAGFRRYHRKSAEAGLKYFLFGASWVYGASGTTLYGQLENGFVQGHGQPLLFGMLLVVGAFAFKMSAAPFHMWAPDTYEGSPIPVAAFLSTVPKVAMIGASVRLFLAVSTQLSEELMLVLAALAILSIVMGNLVALTQREVTRLAAYSGVAQIGYLLIGISALVGLEGAGRHHLAQETLGSLFFYLLVYTITNMAFWIIVLTVGKARGSTELDAFNGLSQSAPYLSFALMISVFSLAGVPPLAGFIGKLYLFRAALYSQPLMALIGVIGSVISLYYYFNILRRCYFLSPPEHVKPLEIPGSTNVLLSLLLLFTVLGGLLPGLTKVCFYVAERMLLQ